MRTLYVVACVLLGLAALLRLGALHFASGSARILATETQRRSVGDEPRDERAYAEAKSQARASDITTGMSLLAALAGVGLYIYSFVHGFRKKPVIPVTLLLIYLALLLIIV